MDVKDRHGPFGGRGTQVDDTEKAHCTVAVRAFEGGEYQECSDIYRQILIGRSAADSSNCYRLKHNILISDFLHNECKYAEKFYQDLRSIFHDANIQNENHTAESIFDSVLLFNLAVIYFHHKQYENAVNILEKLSPPLPLNNAFSRKLNLLYIEVLLRLQQYDRAMAEIEHFESQLIATKFLNSEGISEKKIMDSVVKDQSEVAAIPEDFVQVFKRLKQMQTSCFLGMNSLGSAGDTLSFLSSSEHDLISMHLKARHEFLCGNWMKTVEVLEELRKVYGNENYFAQTGDHLNLALINNLGCAQFAKGNINVGCFKFAEASQFCDIVEYKNKKTQPVHCLAYNKKYEILYNLGVAMLKVNRSPKQAYSYLSKCRKPFWTNPRLWLRLAECCIEIYLETQRNWTAENPTQPTPQDASEVEENQPQPTLTYALDCIQTALEWFQMVTVHREGCLYVKPSRPITSVVEIAQLEASILCTGAYIASLLQKYEIVFDYCAQVKRMSYVSNDISFLVNLYLGEALVKQRTSTRSN